MADETETLKAETLTPEQIAEQEQKEKEGLFTPKKRGSRMIDRYGKLEKKRRAIDIGISDLLLPPVTRKSIATYRILGTDQINISTKEPVEPVDVMLPGTYMLYDPGQGDFDKRNILFKNLSRPDIRLDKQSGKQFIDDDLINDLIFVRGVLRVDPEKQYRTYVFLELHPLNKTNNHRNKAVTPIFERIDLNNSRNIAFKMAEQDLAFEAEAEVRAMTEIDKVRGYATSAGIETMENGKPRAITAVKADLRVYARNNPKGFFSLGNNVKAAIKMNVLDAISWGLIEVDPLRKSFVNQVTDEKTLHTYGVQEDPVDSYVNFLATEEGKEQYEALVNMVEYWK